MEEFRHNLIQNLKKLTSQLKKVKKEKEREMLASLGIELETFIAEIPQRMFKPVEILHNALQGLQTLYLLNFDDCEDLLESIEFILSATIEYFQKSPNRYILMNEADARFVAAHTRIKEQKASFFCALEPGRPEDTSTDPGPEPDPSRRAQVIRPDLPIDEMRDRQVPLSPPQGSEPDTVMAFTVTIHDIALKYMEVDPLNNQDLNDFLPLIISGRESVPVACPLYALLQKAAELVATGTQQPPAQRTKFWSELGRLIEQAQRVDEEQLFAAAELSGEAPATTDASQPQPSTELPGSDLAGEMPSLDEPMPMPQDFPALDEPMSASEAFPSLDEPPAHVIPAPPPPPINMVRSESQGTEYFTLPQEADKEIMSDFITESREYIEKAEIALLALEINPEDNESINVVFRAFHTVKGTAALLEILDISSFAHHAETLLSRVREKEIRCTGGYADLALKAVDMLKALLQNLQDALAGQPFRKPDGYDYLFQILQNPESAGISAAEDDIVAVPRVGDILVAQGKVNREDVEAAAESQQDSPIGTALVQQKKASATDVAQALRVQKKMGSGDAATEEASVRVRIDRLDRLLDMVGELVIAHSMVAQDELVQKRNEYELQKKVAHTGKIVRELQDLSMSMRMVPLKSTFHKMVRLVRDLSRKNGKIIDLQTNGEDTEIDRNMVDVINDILVHMVRNSVDHGIESPTDREAKGKTSNGTIVLSAYHAGGNVIVEIRDDGKGLDRERILEKARKKGLIDSERNLSDHEVYNLIFEPGFSTVDNITDISGRGVGMDVVKRGVEKLRGRIEISTQKDVGCCFIMRMPLTMAITDGMLIKIGNQRFILPTLNIINSFQPTRESLFSVAGKGEMVIYREALIPILRLHLLFAAEGAVTDPVHGLLVVIDEGANQCALLVDELLGQQQVVVKKLSGGLGDIEGISGGAILGDGRVGLILDPHGIVNFSKNA
jgi:two-component system chemotaxis sensor kinase CheA